MPRTRKFSEGNTSLDLNKAKHLTGQEDGRDVPAGEVLGDVATKEREAQRARSEAVEHARKKEVDNATKNATLMGKFMNMKFMEADTVEELLDDSRRGEVLALAEKKLALEKKSQHPTRIEEYKQSVQMLKNPELLLKNVVTAASEHAARLKGPAKQAFEQRVTALQGLQSRYNEEKLTQIYAETQKAIEMDKVRHAEEIKAEAARRAEFKANYEATTAKIKAQQNVFDRATVAEASKGLSAQQEANTAAAQRYERSRQAGPMGFAAAIAEKSIKNGRFDDAAYNKAMSKGIENLLASDKKGEGIYRKFAGIDQLTPSEVIARRREQVQAQIDLQDARGEESNYQDLQAERIRLQEVEDAIALTKEDERDAGPELTFVSDEEIEEKEKKRQHAIAVLKNLPDPIQDTGGTARKRNTPIPIRPLSRVELQPLRDKKREQDLFEADIAKLLKEGVEIDPSYKTIELPEEKDYNQKYGINQKKSYRTVRTSPVRSAFFQPPPGTVNIEGPVAQTNTEYAEQQWDEIQLDSWKKATWLLKESKKNNKDWKVMKEVLTQIFPEIDVEDPRSEKMLVYLMADKMAGNRFVPQAKEWAPQRSSYKERSRILREINEGDITGEVSAAKRARKLGERTAIVPPPPDAQPMTPPPAPKPTLGQRVGGFFKGLFGRK